jgi:hypothetical protein
VLLPYKNENKKKIAGDHPQEDLAIYFGYRIKRKVNLFFKPCYLLVTRKYQQPRRIQKQTPSNMVSLRHFFPQKFALYNFGAPF